MDAIIERCEKELAVLLHPRWDCLIMPARQEKQAVQDK